MEKYYYTKDVNPDVLSDMIHLEASFDGVICAVGVVKNQDGTIPDDNVEITAERVLNSEELDTLADLFNNYGPAHPLVVRHDIKHNIVIPDSNKLSEILLEFAADNIYRGKDFAAADRLFTKLDKILRYANAGAKEMTFLESLKLTADSDLPQDQLDEFIRRFKLIVDPTTAAQIEAGVAAGVL